MVISCSREGWSSPFQEEPLEVSHVLDLVVFVPYFRWLRMPFAVICRYLVEPYSCFFLLGLTPNYCKQAYFTVNCYGICFVEYFFDLYRFARLFRQSPFSQLLERDNSDFYWKTPAAHTAVRRLTFVRFVVCPILIGL